MKTLVFMIILSLSLIITPIILVSHHCKDAPISGRFSKPANMTIISGCGITVDENQVWVINGKSFKPYDWMR